MASKKRTRSASGNKYIRAPSDLPESDLPTHSDIASYFSLICASEKDFNTQIKLVRKKLVEVWCKCNPRLPLLNLKRIFEKLKTFLTKVKSYDHKSLKLQARQHLLSLKDKLFDISACSCTLPIVDCDNRSVQCKVENCTVTHILCQCPSGCKVPDIEREYLRDQRSKVGTKGQFQMRGRDLAAAAQERARQQREEEKEHRRQEHLEEIIVTPDIEVSTRSNNFFVKVPVLYWVR
jgi:hypothetical protein